MSLKQNDVVAETAAEARLDKVKRLEIDAIPREPPTPDKEGVGQKCEVCGKHKESVSMRQNNYGIEIDGDETSMYIACDSCDEQNIADI
jgi:hypothetical protein